MGYSITELTEATYQWICASAKDVRGSIPSSVINGQCFCSNLLNGEAWQSNTAVITNNCGKS
jgi:hypothetical protein